VHSTGEILGLIAGAGRLPLDIARAASARGYGVAAIAFRDATEPAIVEAARSVTWLEPGEVLAALTFLESSGARRAVMAGKVPKSILYADAAAGLDAMATSELAALPDRRDDVILGRVADVLASRGIELLPQLELVPELVAGTGPLGATAPSAVQRDDFAFGWPVAKTLADLDVGQTVLVKDRAVLAVEAIEGTDAAIRRGGAIASGAVVVKVAKPRQDPRFDVPAIGPETVRVMCEARVAALAFEAGHTVVIDREAAVALADAHGIALVGIAPDAHEFRDARVLA